MRRALLILIFALLVAPARADVQVYDVTTGAVRPVVGTGLAGWSDDGAALLFKQGGGLQQVRLADGVTTPLPQRLTEALSRGPGGRTVEQADGSLVVRSGDGRVVAQRATTSIFDSAGLTFAWSRDGGRLAMTGNRWLAVYDTDSGKVLLHRAFDVLMTQQAFSPDGTALLGTTENRVVRLDLTTRHMTTVHRSDWFVDAAWGPDGRIALTLDDGIAVTGLPTLRMHSASPALWSGDGTRLLLSPGSAKDCSNAGGGLAVAAPGRPARPLPGLAGRAVETAVWAPVGTLLAVESTPAASEQRGQRHPWPKRIARRYHMATAGGDAALRRLVLRASRSLRRGAGREETLQRVRTDYVRVSDRYDEAMDTIVREAVADQIDAWLVAAGFEPIEAFDEITC